MSELQYLIWFIATAVMTIIVLVVGTMAAAELLPRRRHGSRDEGVPRTTQLPALPDASPSADAGDADRPVGVDRDASSAAHRSAVS